LGLYDGVEAIGSSPKLEKKNTEGGIENKKKGIDETVGRGNPGDRIHSQTKKCHHEIGENIPVKKGREKGDRKCKKAEEKRSRPCWCGGKPGLGFNKQNLKKKKDH